jgi:hypothetical protein
VADGLGHGPEARAASRPAVALAARSPQASPAALLSSCHEELRGTRGAVVAAISVDEEAREMVHASVGNVAAHLQRDRGATRFLSTPGSWDPRDGRPGFTRSGSHSKRASCW